MSKEIIVAALKKKPAVIKEEVNNIVREKVRALIDEMKPEISKSFFLVDYLDESAKAGYAYSGAMYAKGGALGKGDEDIGVEHKRRVKELKNTGMSNKAAALKAKKEFESGRKKWDGDYWGKEVTSEDSDNNLHEYEEESDKHHDAVHSALKKLKSKGHEVVPHGIYTSSAASSGGRVSETSIHTKDANGKKAYHHVKGIRVKFHTTPPV